MIFSRVVFRILKSDINRSTGKPPSVTKRIAPPKEFYTDKKLSVALNNNWWGWHTRKWAWMRLLFERIGDQHKHLLPLIHQQHEAQVPNTLLWEAASSNQLDALHLTEMCGITQHVDEHELCNIAMPVVLVILPECIPQHCTLLSNHCSLICCSFTSPDWPDHIPANFFKKQTQFQDLHKFQLHLSPYTQHTEAFVKQTTLVEWCPCRASKKIKSLQSSSPMGHTKFRVYKTVYQISLLLQQNSNYPSF